MEVTILKEKRKLSGTTTKGFLNVDAFPRNRKFVEVFKLKENGSYNFKREENVVRDNNKRFSVCKSFLEKTESML